MKINFLLTHRTIECKHFRFSRDSLKTTNFFVDWIWLLCLKNGVVTNTSSSKPIELNTARKRKGTIAIGTKQSRTQSNQSTTLKPHKFIYSRLSVLDFHIPYLFTCIENSHAVISFAFIVEWKGAEAVLFFHNILWTEISSSKPLLLCCENIRCLRIVGINKANHAVCIFRTW